MMVNMSPAMPTIMGSIRPRVEAVATAASIALPPFISMRTPAIAASG